MNIFFFFLTAAFLLKILFNFSVPLILIAKEEGEGVSLMPIEVFFLLLIVLYAYVNDSFMLFGFGPVGIAVFGVALIFISYLSCFVTCALIDRRKDT